MIVTEVEKERCRKVLCYLQPDVFVSRNDLRMWTMMGDRVIRRSIELLRKEGFFIINQQDGNGYMRVSKTEKNMPLILQQIKHEKSRAKKIMDNILPMINYVHGSTALFE